MTPREINGDDLRVGDRVRASWCKDGMEHAVTFTVGYIDAHGEPWTGDPLDEGGEWVKRYRQECEWTLINRPSEQYPDGTMWIDPVSGEEYKQFGEGSSSKYVEETKLPLIPTLISNLAEENRFILNRLKPVPETEVSGSTGIIKWADKHGC